MSPINTLIKRLMKYLIEGFVVAAAAYWIPTKTKLAPKEIAMIALTSAATLSVLDYFAPSIYNGY